MYPATDLNGEGWMYPREDTNYRTPTPRPIDMDAIPIPIVGPPPDFAYDPGPIPPVNSLDLAFMDQPYPTMYAAGPQLDMPGMDSAQGTSTAGTAPGISVGSTPDREVPSGSAPGMFPGVSSSGSGVREVDAASGGDDGGVFDLLLDLVLGNDAQAAPGDGAIVITVNYMFMNGGNTNPGRTGLLVVTLPNNATNREPRIISQFIQLATRMAYTALVHNGPKPKPGITLEKFNSFRTLRNTDAVCAICFEPYERAHVGRVSDIQRVLKRRKLSPDVGASLTTDPATEGSASAASTLNTGNASGSSSGSSSGNTDENTSANTPDEETKTYLCEHDEEFTHEPLEMPCGHVFGKSCLAHWLKESTSCPLCRRSVAEPVPETEDRVRYIRFSGGGHTQPASEQPAVPEQREHVNPGLLQRATLLIFNRDLPPPLAPRETAGPRNASLSPVIDSILNYFQRNRARRMGVFASGVSSRRTADGVETATSEDAPLGDSFENLTSLTGDFDFASWHDTMNGSRTNDRAASDTTNGSRTNDRAASDTTNEGTGGGSDNSSGGDGADASGNIERNNGSAGNIE